MRTIGMPELLVVTAIGAVVWFFVIRGRREARAGSRTCASCGQRVPDVGIYCAFCGQKMA